MKIGGICIETRNAARLAEFYSVVLQEQPHVEGTHYAFSMLAISASDASAKGANSVWLQCFDADVDALYARLLHELPDIEIISPPERRPWGAYSFWFADPDGNKIAVAQAEEQS